MPETGYRKASRVVGQEQKDTEEFLTLELIGKGLAKRNVLLADPHQALVNLIDIFGTEANIEGEDGYSS